MVDMVVRAENFKNIKNGIGVTCINFMPQAHSFNLSYNTITYKYGSIGTIKFNMFPEVKEIKDIHTIKNILKHKNGLYYSYSLKRYKYRYPKESFDDFVKLYFSNTDKKYTSQKFYYVLYD